MDTYGNTGNEGQRGDGDGYDNGNTYGTQGNEPSQHRGNNERGSTHPSQNGSGSNAQGGYYTGGSSSQGNEPPRHSNYNPNTFGTYGNEPSRHNRDIDIFVHSGNRGAVSMTANLDWTLDKLHSSCARKCGMDPRQCHSNCAGVPVSGDRKVHTTSISHGSTVYLSVRLRGG